MGPAQVHVGGGELINATPCNLPHAYLHRLPTVDTWWIIDIPRYRSRHRLAVTIITFDLAYFGKARVRLSIRELDMSPRALYESSYVRCQRRKEAAAGPVRIIRTLVRKAVQNMMQVCRVQYIRNRLAR
jgi:hypothetical protein